MYGPTRKNRIPRVIVLARSLSFYAAQNRLNESASFHCFITAVEETEPLRLAELGGMLDGLKWHCWSRSPNSAQGTGCLRAQGQNAPSFGIGDIITSLRFIGERRLERYSRTTFAGSSYAVPDPAGVYPRMDPESREQYRPRVAKIAAHSDFGEPQACAAGCRHGARRAALSAILPRITPRSASSRRLLLCFDQTGSQPFQPHRISTFAQALAPNAFSASTRTRSTSSASKSLH